MIQARRGRPRARRPRYRPPQQSFLDQRYSVKDLATKAWSGVKAIRRLINVETKTISTSISETPGTTATFVCLNICSQGNDDINRTGDSVLAKSMEFNAYCLQSDANTAYDLTRVIVFYDRENRGAFPAATDLLTASSLTSLSNVNNESRFVILSDRLLQTEHIGSGKKTNVITFSYVFPTGFHLRWSGNVGDITDIRQNGLFIMLLAKENTNKTSFVGSARVSFYDN